MDKIRDKLLALSYATHGNWQDLLKQLKDNSEIKREEIEKAYLDCKASFVTIGEDNYPANFKETTYPPILFYYYGNLSLLKSKYLLTTVGSRQSTTYQLEKSAKFIEDLEANFDNKVAIVSGMAKGMDCTLMKIAADLGAPVVAVLGSGIDNPYPKDNEGIYNYCKSGKGLIISEYPSKEECKKENLLFRNRLIAAISPIIYVGSGTTKSGSSSVVKYGIEMNKEIVALPCDEIDQMLPNMLIKEGANSILKSDDLINACEDRYHNL